MAGGKVMKFDRVEVESVFPIPDGGGGVAEGRSGLGAASPQLIAAMLRGNPRVPGGFKRKSPVMMGMLAAEPSAASVRPILVSVRGSLGVVQRDSGGAVGGECDDRITFRRGVYPGYGDGRLRREAALTGSA